MEGLLDWRYLREGRGVREGGVEVKTIYSHTLSPGDLLLATAHFFTPTQHSSWFAGYSDTVHFSEA